MHVEGRHTTNTAFLLRTPSGTLRASYRHAISVLSAIVCVRHSLRPQAPVFIVSGGAWACIHDCFRANRFAIFHSGRTLFSFLHFCTVSFHGTGRRISARDRTAAFPPRIA